MGFAEEVNRPRHIEEGLVDRHPLDQRSEVVEHVDDQVAQALILGEVSTDEDQVGAQPLGPPTGHRPVHAERPRLVRGGQYHTATDGDRPPLQARIEQLFHRGIERIEIGMQDGCATRHRATISNTCTYC